jgi:TPR repeat protein
MADVAHELSGPASAKLGDIAPQVASRPDSSDRGKLRVFISYSRDDLYFANQLDAALKAYGFECFIDREGISGGEEWKQRLGNLIRDADTVVFVLSPTSARSEICAWEVGEAARLGKRILPVNCRSLEGAIPPPRLRDLNYIFFYADPKVLDSGFGTGLLSLVEALNTDFDWLREHTRYLQRATEWDRGGRPANRLLSGDDIAEAKAWAARRPKDAPEPTTLHLDFIRASEEEAEARSSAQRKQLEEMAAAQTERETALRQAEEALKQAADAQRRRARIRNIAFLLVVGILALLVGSLALYSVQQRKLADGQRELAETQRAGRAAAEEQRAVAEEQREQADRILKGATTIIVNLQHQMDVETKKQVFAVFQTGADHGDAVAMGNLGLLYAIGQGVTQDHAQAREWYEKAAAKGEATAMFQLGRLYANGLGVTQDHVQAREWYEKAADKGNSLAMNDLGWLYDTGQGVAQDYAKAREWFEKAADKGEANAMVNLGVLYANGRGVTQDHAQAREWYEKAADKGNSLAMNNLGALYANGQGVAQDHAKAREWFEKAADKGEANAMNALGWLYHNGLGVTQDYAKAREWYEKAADKGDALAMNNLGAIYHNGLGVTQDHAQAREWFEKAADKGDALAMNNLGELYHNGLGVTQDYAKAREWYEKAADKGDERAKAKLAQLSIGEAFAAGRYGEALRLQEALVVKVEAAETEREGKPGEETAQALNEVAWHALFAGEFTKAFTVADRAHSLLPDNVTIDTNRAHALMFLGSQKESKALYLAHKGKPLSDGKLWERAIAEDFAEFRKAGLTHPMMAEIEKELGVSP